MTSVGEWWRGLDQITRDKLMSDPFGPIPLEAVKAGDPLAAGTWWPETESGPAGLRFSWNVQRKIELYRLLKVESDLMAEQSELLERYFPVSEGPGPIVFGKGFPDAATRERYFELDRLIDQASAARREFIVESGG